MKAVLCRAFGGPEALTFEDLPSQLLGPGQVRIRVRACGLNFADTLMIAGQYQVKPPFPFVPGIEIAGEVAETGAGVAHLTPGMRVVAYLRAAGGFAEELVIRDELVVPIPDAMDFVTAAAFPVAYGTSHFALTHRGDLRAGETLLVLGAAGGVGLTAVEIGKRLGARDRGSRGCREMRRRPRVRRRRGDRLPDGEHPRPGAGADRRRGRGRGVRSGGRRCVRPGAARGELGGADADYRLASGRVPSAPANLVLVKNISVIGVVWGAHSDRDPAFIAAKLRELLRWWEAGELRPRVATTFPLRDVAAAMRALLSREHAGKIVLTA